MRWAITATVVVMVVVSTACTAGSSRARPGDAAPQSSLATTTSVPVTAPVHGLGTSGSSELDTDLDGDGRPDHFSISAADSTAENHGQRTMDVVLSDGTTHHGTFVPADRLVLFPVDIDQDGRTEVLVRTGGDTWTTGTLVVFSRNRLEVVSFADNGNQFFGWTAHSNCCPGGTADVACLTVDGQPSFVVTSSQYVPDDWDGAYPVPLVPGPDPFITSRRGWTRTVYRLEDSSLVASSHDTGIVAHDAPGPPGVPLDNRLACGNVTDQGA